MSRIGKKPVEIPAGVKVSHDAAARTVAVEGPKGKMTYTYHPVVSVEVADGRVACSIPQARMGDGPSKALWGTTRSRLQGMVTGVTKGFSERLEVVGVGWNARLQGRSLVLSVGYCNPRTLPIPQGIDCTVENNIINVSGYDKQAVGQFASVIRDQRRPEPYNGKGVKYVGETIIRKQGKAFGA
jgi:large subunit ribosomal protein L6